MLGKEGDDIVRDPNTAIAVGPTNEMWLVRPMDSDDRNASCERVERLRERRETQDEGAIGTPSHFSTRSLTKKFPTGVGDRSAPMTAPVSAIVSSRSQTVTDRAVRSTRARMKCDSSSTSVAGIQPSVPFGRTGIWTRSHSPSGSSFEHHQTQAAAPVGRVRDPKLERHDVGAAGLGVRNEFGHLGVDVSNERLVLSRWPNRRRRGGWIDGRRGRDNRCGRRRDNRRGWFGWQRGERNTGPEVLLHLRSPAACPRNKNHRDHRTGSEGTDASTTSYGQSRRQGGAT